MKTTQKRGTEAETGTVPQCLLESDLLSQTRVYFKAFRPFAEKISGSQEHDSGLIHIFAFGFGAFACGNRHKTPFCVRFKF
jgi:hypothetical protein